jgi:hypothetical protein
MELGGIAELEPEAEADWLAAVAGAVCAGAFPAQRRSAAETARGAVRRMNKDCNTMNHSIGKKRGKRSEESGTLSSW